MAANGDLETEGERATAREAEKFLGFSVLEFTRKNNLPCSLGAQMGCARRARGPFAALAQRGGPERVAPAH